MSLRHEVRPLREAFGNLEAKGLVLKNSYQDVNTNLYFSELQYHLTIAITSPLSANLRIGIYYTKIASWPIAKSCLTLKSLSLL